MSEKNLRPEIDAWADANMLRHPACTIYPMWGKCWFDAHEHTVRKLILVAGDTSADIALWSCNAGYCGNKDSWHGINLGYAKSLDEIVRLYNWLNDTQGEPQSMDWMEGK